MLLFCVCEIFGCGMMISCRMDEEEDKVVDPIIMYTFSRFYLKQPCNTIAIFLRATDGESGAKYILYT